MSTELTATARRVGIGSAVSVVVLQVTYAVTLAVGFWPLDTPQQPIGDPMCTVLEVMILAMVPGMVPLAGLSGIVVGDVGLRNIGVAGYLCVFLVVAVLLALLFYRPQPVRAASAPG